MHAGKAVWHNLNCVDVVEACFGSLYHCLNLFFNLNVCFNFFLVLIIFGQVD